MGAGQSTRSIPDYVHVDMCVNDTGYVSLYLFVDNIENAVKFRMFMRKRDDRMHAAADADTPPLEPCEYWPTSN